jgi:phage repressor protein C with HTH and peptisase S24 domain
MLGRNASYIQQYVHRGVPKRLGEVERRKLARYFGVPETELGSASVDGCVPNGLVGVSRLSSDGGTTYRDDEHPARNGPYFAFDDRWLSKVVGSSSPNLSMVSIAGDSMSPTLNDGDDVLVEHPTPGSALRDGIYLLRVQGLLLPRRIVLNPTGAAVTVRADSPAYPDWPDCHLSDLDVVGRVVWFGRRLV